MPPPPPGFTSPSMLHGGANPSNAGEDSASSVLPSPPPLPRKEPTIQHVSRFTPVPPLPSSSGNGSHGGGDNNNSTAEKRSMDRYEEVPVQLSLSKRPRGRLPTVSASSATSSSSTASASLEPPPVSHSTPQPSSPLVDPMFTPPLFENQQQRAQDNSVTTSGANMMMNEFKSDDGEGEFMDAEDSS
jgi:hypothetical protein